jgi:sugar phosphate isomerase/epimerase
MLIGAMNHPGRPVGQEIEWMAAAGLEFIDLTLEPPLAAAWNIDVPAVRTSLEKHQMQAVGHTAYYLPLASPFEKLRRAAVEEVERCLDIFARLGVAWVNIHPDRHAPFHDQQYVIHRNVESLRELLSVARSLGLGLMIENLPGELSTVSVLRQFLEPLPELGLHLDIGHANLLVTENATEALLGAFATRVRHVHLHDNKGGAADLHLPLGTGNIDVARHIGALKASGYDGTITLEVFSSDGHYLMHSRDVLRQLWNGAQPLEAGLSDLKTRAQMRK